MVMWQWWVVRNSRSWAARIGPRPVWSVRTTPVAGGQGLVGQVHVQHHPGAGSRRPCWVSRSASPGRSRRSPDRSAVGFGVVVGFGCQTGAGGSGSVWVSDVVASSRGCSGGRRVPGRRVRRSRRAVQAGGSARGPDRWPWCRWVRRCGLRSADGQVRVAAQAHQRSSAVVRSVRPASSSCSRLGRRGCRRRRIGCGLLGWAGRAGCRRWAVAEQHLQDHRRLGEEPERGRPPLVGGFGAAFQRQDVGEAVDEGVDHDQVAVRRRGRSWC